MQNQSINMNHASGEQGRNEKAKQMLSVLSQRLGGGGKGKALICAARTSGLLAQKLLPEDDAECSLSVLGDSVSSCPEVLLHARAVCVYGGYLPHCLRRQSP